MSKQSAKRLIADIDRLMAERDAALADAATMRAALRALLERMHEGPMWYRGDDDMLLYGACIPVDILIAARLAAGPAAVPAEEDQPDA